jgi:hypothetical protein
MKILEVIWLLIISQLLNVDDMVSFKFLWENIYITQWVSFFLLVCFYGSGN